VSFEVSGALGFSGAFAYIITPVIKRIIPSRIRIVAVILDILS
jgi:hypothetical protein